MTTRHTQMRNAINDVELALNGLEIDSVARLMEGADDSVMVKLPLGAVRQLAQCYPELNRIINDETFEKPDVGPAATPPRLGLEAAMEIVGNMRQSEAGLFDAQHSGQRGCDRADALFDAYVAIRKAALATPQEQEPIMTQELTVEYTASKGLSRVWCWVTREEGERVRAGATLVSRPTRGGQHG